jgi:transposase
MDQQVKDNLRVKEIRIDGADTRFVLCHNPDQQVRDAAKRTEAITRIEAELVRIADQRARDKNKTLTDKARTRNEEAHLRAECALREHPTLGRGFRDMKSELLLRPVFHRLDHRIRAHVLICWLALLLVRVRTSGQTWRQINRETSRLKQVTLAGPAGTIVQTTPLRPEQKAIYQALSITPPPRMSAFEPS